MARTSDDARPRPACWWCGEGKAEVREMEVGSQRVSVCALCWLALETLRERALQGRGVG